MTSDDLEEYYSFAKTHRANHECGGIPYENKELLISTLQKTRAKRILEIGTGVGYSAACFVYANPHCRIDTIDKDPHHIELAEENWLDYDIQKNITPHPRKAEEILPTLYALYDLIFYDGNIPKNSLLFTLEKKLKKGGTLLTANLFLNDPTGGRYVKKLQDIQKWQTTIHGDTAISIKL